MAPLKSLSEIPTLTLLYKLQRLHPAHANLSNATSAYNDKISLIRTDITTLRVDAIVNAANESLLGGGGVDGAIHRAAGPGLVKECRTLDGCDTGDAKITDAYELPCAKVIHAVGPVYWATKKKGKHTSLLQSCYRKCLDLAVDNGCKSVAFSALSTGVYGYPSNEAAAAAIAEVRRWLDEDEGRASLVERIVFCSFLEKDEKAYEEHIPKFFAPAKDETKSEAKEVEEDQKDTKAQAASQKGSPVPQLPNAPTKQPTEEGQPDFKKRKTGHESDEGVGYDADKSNAESETRKPSVFGSDQGLEI